MTHITMRLFLSALLVTTVEAKADQMFGYPGRDGAYGYSGRSGTNGAPATVTATGSAQSIYSFGTDGEQGGPGENGQAATNCYQPYTESNLIGAPGGSGGNSGPGGNAGNGGAVTGYYQDQNALKAIYINAAGGRGGNSNYSGYGARACYCYSYSWQINGITYYCHDGRDGLNGYNGGPGRNGAPGQLTLIPQLTPLDPVQPTIQTNFSDVARNSHLLSDYQWTTMSGANQLLAQGSVVADSYRLYTGRTESTFTVDWEFDRNVEDFANVSASLYLQNRFAAINLPSDVWMDARNLASGPNTIYKVVGALYQSEVQALTFDSISGSGSDLIATFLDQSGYPDLVKTDFHIRYYSRARVLMRLRYDGTASSSLVSRQGNKITIALGHLPIDPSYFAPGLEIEVDVDATRSFAGKSVIVSSGKDVVIN